ncbi:MAG TPA: cellulase family glycosylhydrolase [Kofleriaceae bacterium]
MKPSYPLLLASLFAACATTDDSTVTREVAAQPPPPRLRADHTNLVDPTTSKPIVMTGYNWGQWNTMQDGDAADNVRQGANSVRIPLRWWGDWKSGADSRVEDPEVDYIDPAHFDLLISTVKAATAKHMWVTIFVDSNYGQGASDVKGSFLNFWMQPTEKAKFKQVWRHVVNEFKTYPYIAAYEILPEPRPQYPDANGNPVPAPNQDVKQFYDDFIDVVRAIDTTTPIVVGPNNAYNLHDLDDAFTNHDPSNNVIYTGDYFIYDDGEPTARLPYIQDFLTTRKRPVWINQVGIRSGYADPFTKADQVLDGLAAMNVGWSWLTFREDTDSPDEHGIYYKPNGAWQVKPCWYRFVPGYFWPPGAAAPVAGAIDTTCPALPSSAR